MQTLRWFLRVLLIILDIFLALTAIAGGIALLARLNAPPVEQLQGSIFQDFTIPGLALLVLVGGSALLAGILLIRRSKYALLASLTAAIIIMFFEFVEVMVIGSPPGVARTLQIFYYGLGIIISVVTAGIWFIDIRLK
jgi:hypothetical protein